jgi:membrane protein
LVTRFKQVKDIGSHPAIAKPREVYARHRYSTPLFVLRETMSAFQLHNGLGMSASLSFYAMLALIPMALLMFFMLSHLIISSDYAIVKLAILTSNLVPKLSGSIMVEVYNIAQHKAVWGVFGMIALFWVVTPLAGSLRSAFYTIAAIVETPSFIKRKIKDILAVLGMLLLFFLFTFSGLVMEKVITFLNPAAAHSSLINSVGSFVITTLLIAAFYRIFFPGRVAIGNILAGSVVTALLWLAMRPAFTLFMTINPSYGTMFGGMQNMFISIGWLYYTFAVFLVGTEIIGTLHKKDILILRGLFGDMPSDKDNYLRELMARYGRQYKKNDLVFSQGEQGHDLYYIVTGQIKLISSGRVIRQLEAGDYFGEMALLTDTPRIADALVESASADVIVISAENIQTLLLSNSNVAMNFLKQMANHLQDSHQRPLT